MRGLRTALAACVVIGGTVLAGGSAIAASGPPAPSPISPTDGASLTVPFTLAWSSVEDPSGIDGYNWQVSTSSAFGSIAEQDSVNAPTTQDTASGLPNGTYFWRVQAVDNDLIQGPWSSPQSF